MRFRRLKDLSPLQLDTGRVRYTRRAMQTFGKPDCKLYSFIIRNSLRGDGFVGTDGNCCKNARHCIHSSQSSIFTSLEQKFTKAFRDSLEATLLLCRLFKKAFLLTFLGTRFKLFTHIYVNATISFLHINFTIRSYMWP